MSKEYTIVGESTVLNGTPYPFSFKLKTPRNDIKELAYSLIFLLRDDIPWKFTQNLWQRSDEEKMKSEEFDVFPFL